MFGINSAKGPGGWCNMNFAKLEKKGNLIL